MRTNATPGALALLLLTLAGCGRMMPDAPAATTPPMRSVPVAGMDAGLIDDGIDGGTHGRVTRAGSGLQACVATLAAARVEFVPVPDRVNSASCGLTGAGQLTIDRGTVARLAPAAPTLTCETALALSVWRRQSIEPAARELLGSDVVQIDHYGTYACRGINGQVGARPSAHSRAAAIDIAGVRLRDGRRVTVSGDWARGGAEAAFLKRIRDDACRIFGTTLSPDYNAAHADHLHLEPDGRLCR